ncbi:MAG: hydroxymethylglutaryl-CoA reductase [Desulfobacteraceae bacterium]|nr:hydroxymethylglutaryl-CoA reductase [Desulfobacteraceae bacterium]
MPQTLKRSQELKQSIVEQIDEKEFVQKLTAIPTESKALPDKIPARDIYSKDGLKKRQNFLKSRGLNIEALQGDEHNISTEDLKGSIENLIGFAQIPVGIIGPLRVNGVHANDDYYIPLATTEGALVASYNRGAYAISLAGGASSLCVTEGVSRAPCFHFKTIAQAGLFLNWLLSETQTLFEAVQSATAHGKLVDIKPTINGSSVYLILDYTTGDASGQNMVTVATQAICDKILTQSPVKPQNWYIEGNLSGDKKASMLSFLGVRGKKVIAETILPKQIIQKVLHSTPEDMERYCRISTLGGIQSGQIGVQGHYANALAAIYIACGQDVACVSEAAIGITDMHVNIDGNLHVTVSLPNLIVGTVGGGTYLPTAKECLKIMDCYGKNKAKKFAEICAAVVMAGEISIIAALAAGHFSIAHAIFRKKHEVSE